MTINIENSVLQTILKRSEKAEEGFLPSGYIGQTIEGLIGCVDNDPDNCISDHADGLECVDATTLVRAIRYLKEYKEIVSFMETCAGKAPF